MSKSTIVTVTIVVIIGSGTFYGGTIYEKNILTSQGLLRSANRNGFSQGSPQGQNNPGPRGRNSGGFIAGQILSKDDKSVTIKTPDGGSKIVFFSDSTQVGKTAEGSISDLDSGQEVMIGGTPNSDGSLTAQNIQIRPVQPK
jgi:hypothetical protein